MFAKKEAIIQSFEGLISAPFTAFKKDGSVNVDIISKYVDFLVSQGVKGAFVNGTTGEGLSLTVEERKAIAEKWVKHGKDKLKVIIIHIGANCMKDAEELASHAEKIGATGIASLPPMYYTSQETGRIVDYFRELAKSAPATPLMLYHIPSYSKAEFSFRDFLFWAREDIPTFIGAKFTSVDVRDLLKVLRLPVKPLKILSGFDEVLLPCLSCGVTAAVGATYNFMAPLSLKVLEAFKKGKIDEARKYQSRILDAVITITSHGPGISCLKKAMNVLGPLDFGLPRLPLVPLGALEDCELGHDLERMEKEDWRI